MTTYHMQQGRLVAQAVHQTGKSTNLVHIICNKAFLYETLAALTIAVFVLAYFNIF